MNPEEQDRPIRDLIRKHYLPPDLCPSAPDEIEKILDAAGGTPLEEDQIERMLMKAKGDLPVGQREEDEPVWSEEEEQEAEGELLALHRNEGDELPPEVAEKLRRLREQAKEQEETDGDDELDT